jgi:hypothetical protein
MRKATRKQRRKRNIQHKKIHTRKNSRVQKRNKKQTRRRQSGGVKGSDKKSKLPTLLRSRTHGPLGRSTHQRVTLKRHHTRLDERVRDEFKNFIKQRKKIKSIIDNAQVSSDPYTSSDILVKNSILNMAYLIGTSRQKLYCNHLQRLNHIGNLTPNMKEAIQSIIGEVRCSTIKGRMATESVHVDPADIPTADEFVEIYNRILDRNLDLIMELTEKQQNIHGMIRSVETALDMVKRVGVTSFFTAVQFAGLMEGDMTSIGRGIEFLKDIRKYFTSSNIEPVSIFLSSLSKEQKTELDEMLKQQTIHKLQNVQKIIAEEKIPSPKGDGSGEGASKKTTTKSKRKATTPRKKGRRKVKSPSPSPVPESPEFTAPEQEHSVESPAYSTVSPVYYYNVEDENTYYPGPDGFLYNMANEQVDPTTVGDIVDNDGNLIDVTQFNNPNARATRRSRRSRR